MSVSFKLLIKEKIESSSLFYCLYRHWNSHFVVTIYFLLRSNIFAYNFQMSQRPLPFLKLISWRLQCICVRVWKILKTMNTYFKCKYVLKLIDSSLSPHQKIHIQLKTSWNTSSLQTRLKNIFALKIFIITKVHDSAPITKLKGGKT